MKKLLIIALCATSLVMANSGEKECKTKADMIKGCVKIKTFGYGGTNKEWYKGGKLVKSTKTDGRGRLERESSTSIKKIGNLNIQIEKNIDYTPGEDGYRHKSEYHCVLNNKGKCDKDNYLQWKSKWSYNKPITNCVGIGDIDRFYYSDDRAYNGVCETSSISCYKDGKYFKCTDKEKQELLNKDFSDFYKMCVKKYSGDDIDFFPCSK